MSLIARWHLHSQWPLTATIDTQLAADAADPVRSAVGKTCEDANALSKFWAGVRQADTAPVDILAIGESVVEGPGASTISQRWISELVAACGASTSPQA